VGVLEITKFLEMLLQSPLPYFSSPRRNNLQVKAASQHRSVTSKDKPAGSIIIDIRQLPTKNSYLNS
jgi:hypothetical protein